jgi:hypothetical protein
MNKKHHMVVRVARSARWGAERAVRRLLHRPVGHLVQVRFGLLGKLVGFAVVDERLAGEEPGAAGHDDADEGDRPSDAEEEQAGEPATADRKRDDPTDHARRHQQRGQDGQDDGGDSTLSGLSSLRSGLHE